MANMKYIMMVDGKSYNVRLPQGGVKRSFSILDGENSGRVQTGDMVRDIIGTYYNYSIKIEQDPLYPSDYDDLYEVVSNPVDFHTIVVPYAQGIYQFEAYITDGSDTLSFINPNDYTNMWDGLELNFVAMKPRKVPEPKQS